VFAPAKPASRRGSVIVLFQLATRDSDPIVLLAENSKFPVTVRSETPEIHCGSPASRLPSCSVIQADLQDFRLNPHLIWATVKRSNMRFNAGDHLREIGHDQSAAAVVNFHGADTFGQLRATRCTSPAASAYLTPTLALRVSKEHPLTHHA